MRDSEIGHAFFISHPKRFTLPIFWKAHSFCIKNDFLLGIAALDTNNHLNDNIQPYQYTFVQNLHPL